MTHTPHELHDEFPELTDRISELKRTDAHFVRLADQYHDINRQIHGAETLVSPVEELTEVEMRKKRASLKDQIYRMLTASA